MKQVYIGHWNNKFNHYPEFEFPIENPPYDNKNHVQMVEFVLTKCHPKYCKGSSTCRICNSLNGSIEYEIVIKNTKYIIPEGYLHYVKEHFVTPSEEFVTLYNKLKTKNSS